MKCRRRGKTGLRYREHYVKRYSSSSVKGQWSEDQEPRFALRVLPVMRARRLRRLYLAASQRVDLEDALEAHRWLAIRLLRRACLPSCSAGASTGDGGRPARFIRCIHNCDLTRNWIGSHGTKPALERSEGLVPWVLVITRRPTAPITSAVATSI